MHDFWIDENEIKEYTKKIVSPSGRFVLNIRYYTTKNGCWNYSRGTVLRLSDNIEICDIKRDYSVFHHKFVSKNDQEWLITGRSYLSQTIINLDTKEEFESKNECHFCWSDCWLSPDGNTLVVDGCYWGAPYEFRCFDFSNPQNGWPEISLNFDLYSSDKDPIFNPDGTITCYGNNRIFKPLGKYEDELTDEEIESIGDAYDKRDNWEYTNKTILKREGDKLIIVK